MLLLVLFRSDRKSTRLNSSHLVISYAVFCLKNTTTYNPTAHRVPTKLYIAHSRAHTCGSGTRTHTRKTGLRRVSPGTAVRENRCPCVHPRVRSPPARASGR